MNREDRRAAARQAKRDAVQAATEVAEDIASGRIDPEHLKRIAVEQAREMFGHVAGPGDPLWPLQADVFRQVLALGGAISADELSEWVAVYRLAEESAPPTSWIESTLDERMADEDDGFKRNGRLL